ncbi:394ae22b-9f42-46e9-8b71-7da94881c5f1 [Thermothielavioides terrestris]|uniref:394ae22b-9f42-46e9-8b71-7da94881c5f1 n=1 Tax=Thermothielavioides terrestris TaxID=2587410 RepID=A0A446BIG8_9PEZI|nr:394ae22b-9f42-46e9-8b71-7da94881c5f1 [Thermothielavioides terrestris]
MPSLVVSWAMTALLLASLSTANPTISFPLNSQVPPVARIGQLFSFVFSPSTFSSSSAIAYSLSNPPRWLSLDSDARRLFGTPEEEDIAPGRVVAVPLNLVATDDSGSTTLFATLVVSRSPGPMVEIPFDKQAPDFGTFSAPSAILSPPGKAFSFRLDPNTFSKPSDAPVSYYATMADNTPLPAWISFDPASLSFMGQTPPSESLVQPPERFSFQVIASDVVGFAGSSLSFDIVVGNHQLTANKTTIVLNATPGIPVSYTGLRSAVSVDGKPATAQVALVASTPNIPAWLSLDNDTWRITGVPPGTAESTNFTITICDTFSDELNLTVAVNVTRDNAGLFRGTPPNFTVSPGAPFSFDLSPYLLSPLDTEISIKTDPSYSWIRFNSNAWVDAHMRALSRRAGVNPVDRFTPDSFRHRRGAAEGGIKTLVLSAGNSNAEGFLAMVQGF